MKNSLEKKFEKNYDFKKFKRNAEVAELVDALDSGSAFPSVFHSLSFTEFPINSKPSLTLHKSVEVVKCSERRGEIWGSVYQVFTKMFC